MLTERLQRLISSAFAQEVRLRTTSASEILVQVPFHFPDGDGFLVYIRQLADGSYELTDKANTLLHLSYHVDTDRLGEGARAAIFEGIRSRHGVQERQGELVARSPTEELLGSAVFNFVHALIQVADLRFLEREIVRSTFRDDFERLVLERFSDRAIKDYTDPVHDADGKYPVDFLLNGVTRPVAVFGVLSETAALKALVTAQQFISHGTRVRFVAVEEAQESLTRRTVAWLSDTFDKQFSSLHGNEEAISRYLEEEWQTARQLSTIPLLDGTAGN